MSCFRVVSGRLRPTWLATRFSSWRSSFCRSRRIDYKRGTVVECTGHRGMGAHGEVGFTAATALSPVFVGGGGFFFGVSPVLVMGPGSFLPPMAWMGPTFLPARAPLMPPPPPGFLGPNGGIAGNKAKAKPSDPVRSGQLTTLGDRLFRAGNLKKAEERYLQAMRVAPTWPHRVSGWLRSPLRGATTPTQPTRLREAETAEPGWIVNAPDIQTIYGEPTEFARQFGAARDLSCRPIPTTAMDGWSWEPNCFSRVERQRPPTSSRGSTIPNRKSDVALAAFLDASNQAAQQPGKAPEPDDSSIIGPSVETNSGGH